MGKIMIIFYFEFPLKIKGEYKIKNTKLDRNDLRHNLVN